MSLENYLLDCNASIKDALKKLDLGITKVLIVVDQEQFIKGTLTDGDVRRHLLAGHSIEGVVADVYHKSPITLKAIHFTIDIARILIIENKIDLLPLLDENNRVVDVIHRDAVFKNSAITGEALGSLDVPVVVMAGGKGTRMEPFTKILPKPLIPIGDTPIIEVIMDEFFKQGVKDFYLTINFKGEMIEAYFKHHEKPYQIHYVVEKDFQGTAGCLKLLQNEIDEQFIVSNCDVIVKANYEEVVKLHRQENADITVVSSIQHYKIPYGIIEYREGGTITDIKEKPEYSFTVNTGIYVLNRNVLSQIPEDEVFHMTHLIDRVTGNGGKVITYPVNENEYIDIGQWEEYQKAMEKLKILR